MTKNLLAAICISVLTYFCFFYKVLNPAIFLYSGKDVSSFHLPSRYYLSEKLKSGEFPFWTERIFGGFPIYLDLERGFLNPINLLLVYFLGPVWSYKLMHLLFYLAGSMGLFLLLKAFGYNLLSYVTANFIYFFNFFMLFHQQHYAMVLSFYLVPLVLYCTKKAVEGPSRHYAILTSMLMALLIYMGSFQSVTIVFMFQFFFLFTFLKSTQVVASLLRFLLVEFTFCFIAFLPVLVPFLQMFASSSRPVGPTLFVQGSYFPAMFVNLFVPFLFGKGDNYMGVLLNQEFFMHETYIYVGITTLIFGLLGLTLLTSKPLKSFMYVLLVLFLTLGFIKYLPVANTLNIFPIFLFRYWGRSVIFLNFALSICVAHLVSHGFSGVSIKKFSVLIFCIAIYLLGIQSFHFSEFFSLLKLLARDDIIFDGTLWVFAIIIVLFLIFFFSKRRPSVLVVVLVAFDVLFFGTRALSQAFVPIKELVPTTNSENENVRILDTTSKINGLNSLYYSSWGVLGYSIYSPAYLENDLKDLGFSNTKLVPDGFSDFSKLSELGITRVLTESVALEIYSTSAAMQSQVLSAKEGAVAVNVTSSSIGVFNTHLRADPDWQISVNGQKLKQVQKNDTILVPVNSGQTNIQLVYYPKRFYFGLLISSVLLFIFTFCFYKSKAFVS